MATPINNAFLRLSKRAETSAREKLVQTFVDVGPLFSLLSGSDHQILYGRRGTGKTHVLNYLADKKESEGNAVVITDLRNIGSSSGLYADGTIPIPERATRLLVDTLASIHSSLYEFFLELSEELDLSLTGPALDRLADAITQVKVVGSVEEVDSRTLSKNFTDASDASLTLNNSPSLSLNTKNTTSKDENTSRTVSRSGEEQLYVNFGATSSAFRDIVSCMGKRQLWVLLDGKRLINPTLQDPGHSITIKILWQQVFQVIGGFYMGQFCKNIFQI